MKKFAKIVSLMMALVLVSVCFIACGSTKTQTVFKPEGTSKGTLKLGFDADGFEPYGYLDETTNQYVGFDIDLAKAACASIGYTLELIPVSWEAKDMELASGNIDCIWNGFTIDGREDDYTWSAPYADSSIVVLVKGDAIKTLADLAGKNVKVQAGSSGETALFATDDDGNVIKENDIPVWGDLAKTFKNGAPATCAGYTEAFVELETGAVDALVIDAGTAKAMISGKTGYVVLDEAICSEQYGIGFKKGNEALMNTIWNAVIGLDKATIKSICDKYDVADSVIIDD